MTLILSTKRFSKMDEDNINLSFNPYFLEGKASEVAFIPVYMVIMPLQPEPLPQLKIQSSELSQNKTNHQIERSSSSKEREIPSPGTKVRREKEKGKKKNKKIKKKKDAAFTTKIQDPKRNLTTNIVHHLMKFALNREMSQKLVEDIIKKYDLKLQTDQFYNILVQLNRQMKNYIRRESLIQLWRGEKDFFKSYSHQQKQEFSLIIRILSLNFFRSVGRSSILFENKLNKSSKMVHYQELHELEDLLNGLGRESEQIKKEEKSIERGN